MKVIIVRDCDGAVYSADNYGDCDFILDADPIVMSVPVAMALMANYRGEHSINMAQYEVTE